MSHTGVERIVLGEKEGKKWWLSSKQPTLTCGHKINSLHGRWLTLKQQPNLSVFYIYNYVKYVKALFREETFMSTIFQNHLKNTVKTPQMFFSFYIILNLPTNRIYIISLCGFISMLCFFRYASKSKDMVK